jgi:hypothetical protein
VSLQELEREITFQGDSAIYYSYYKDMLKAPSFERGMASHSGNCSNDVVLKESTLLKGYEL